MDIVEIVEKQKVFFQSGKTLKAKYRIDALKALKNSIKSNLGELFDAFKKDLNKSEFDVLSSEITPIFLEINYMIRHIKKLMKPQKVSTGIINVSSYGLSHHNPMGIVLVVSPWNYPINLSIMPLIGAISAGNTAVVKPSAYTPNVSNVIKKILSVFSSDYIFVALGGREQNQLLFEQPFDMIFFTGSKNVGQVVLEKASKNLIPVVLELGGKSPCIVDEDADISIAAKRIVWGKFLNAGQTCVAPDYLWVHNNIKDKFIFALKQEIKAQFYPEGKLSEDYTHIVNEKHVERLKKLIDKEKLCFGGAVKDLVIEPTLLADVKLTDDIMKEEIFGPILPMLYFDDFEEVVNFQIKAETTLAAYYFGKDKHKIKVFEEQLCFGGGAVNDVIMHLTSHKLPFGGVGASGMGRYHGEDSFKTFSSQKSVIYKRRFELPLKFRPHTSFKSKLLKWFLGVK